MPPKVDAKQATGFAVYALRTVIAGNSRELIDLAKANARQLLWGRTGPRFGSRRPLVSTFGRRSSKRPFAALLHVTDWLRSRESQTNDV